MLQNMKHTRSQQAPVAYGVPSSTRPFPPHRLLNDLNSTQSGGKQALIGSFQETTSATRLDTKSKLGLQLRRIGMARRPSILTDGASRGRLES